MVSTERLTGQLQSVVTNGERQLAVFALNLSHQRERRLAIKTEGPEAPVSVIVSWEETWTTAKRVNGCYTSSTSAGSPPNLESSQASVDYVPNSIPPTVPYDRVLKSSRTSSPTTEICASAENNKTTRPMSNGCCTSSISSTACRQKRLRYGMVLWLNFAYETRICWCGEERKQMTEGY